MFRYSMTRRAACLAAGLAVAVAGAVPMLVPGTAWADWEHGRGHGWGHGHGHGRDRVIVIEQAPPPVVYVEPPPRVIYVPEPPPPPPPRRVYARPACDYDWINNELGGNVLGGIAGGVLGHQVGRGSGKTAATIGGAVVGTLIGGSVGRSMDRVDRNCAAQVLAYAPDNRPVDWVGDGGSRYSMQPVRTWQSEGRYCREYQSEIIVGGRRQSTYGQACMQPDGSWEIVN